MHLINEKNDVAVGLDLVNKIFDSAFKLAAELRSGNKSRKVKQMNLFVCKSRRNLAACNFQRKALCNGGFSDSGFTDEAGIVL